MKYLLVGLTCFFLSLSMVGNTWADANDSTPPKRINKNYTKAKELIKRGDYSKAISALLTANQEEPNNADVFNLLGYSHRKLKDWDKGLNYYLQALKIKPNHRGANEYLGELYLQMGKLSKAEERLEVLDKECFFGCKQFDELKAAIEEYKKKNNT